MYGELKAELAFTDLTFFCCRESVDEEEEDSSEWCYVFLSDKPQP